MKRLRNILIGLTCVALTYSLPVTKAQEAGTALSGACIPHLPEQGPWDCKAIAPFKPKCLVGRQKGFDDIWSIVDDEQEAITLLRLKYAEMNDLRKFGQWVACQGFTLVLNQTDDSYLRPRDGQINVEVYYLISKAPPFSVPWYRIVQPWSGGFSILLNKFGAVEDVRHSYTTE